MSTWMVDVCWADHLCAASLGTHEWGGSMSVSEISCGLKFPSPTSSFVTFCIVLQQLRVIFCKWGNSAILGVAGS